MSNINLALKLPKRDMIAAQRVQRYVNVDTDEKYFWKRWSDLTKQKKWVTIIKMADRHYPFHDPDAIDLGYDILSDLDFDLFINGDDRFDYPEISDHKPDYSLQQAVSLDDYIYTIQDYHIQDVKRLHDLNPDVLDFYIVGNHGLRAFLKMAEGDKPRWDTDNYLRFLKQDGAVLWLGLTQDVLLGSLNIMHDGGTSVNVPRKLLQDDNSCHHLCSHTHRPQYDQRVGRRFHAQAMVTGCNCVLIPHYRTKRGYQQTNWRQGMAIVHLNTRDGSASFDNIIYERTPKTIWTRYGGKRYERKLTKRAWVV